MKRPKKHMLVIPRNPVARSPLLAKGGPHQKTSAAQRRLARAQLVRSLRDPKTFE